MELEQSTRHRLNKSFKLEFPVVYLNWHMPDESWRVYWPKCCDKNKKYEDNSPHENSLNNDNSLS